MRLGMLSSQSIEAFRTLNRPLDFIDNFEGAELYVVTILKKQGMILTILHVSDPSRRERCAHEKHNFASTLFASSSLFIINLLSLIIPSSPLASTGKRVSIVRLVRLLVTALKFPPFPIHHGVRLLVSVISYYTSQ